MTREIDSSRIYVDRTKEIKDSRLKVLGCRCCESALTAQIVEHERGIEDLQKSLALQDDSARESLQDWVDVRSGILFP